jgi:hypothetical protein
VLSIYREQAVGVSLYDRDELALEPALVIYLLLAGAVFRVKESSWTVFPSIWVAPRECIILSSLIFLRDGSFFIFIQPVFMHRLNENKASGGCHRF